MSKVLTIVLPKYFLIPFLMISLASCSKSAETPGDIAETSGPGNGTNPGGGGGPTGNPCTGGTGSGETGSINCGAPIGGDGGYVGTPANIAVSPASYNFQIQSVNSLTYATFLVTNTGQSTATGIKAVGLSLPYSFRNGNYPGFRGTCATTLDPYQSCTIVITFNPKTVSRFQLSTFKISCDQNGVSVPLDGSSTDIATLKFSNVTDDNTFYNYGTIAYGQVATKTIHVIYSGAAPATGVAFSGITPPFAITNNTCGSSVSADCDVTVSYTGSNAGYSQQNLKVTYNNSSYAAEDNHLMQGTTSDQVIPATLNLATLNFGLKLVGSSSDATLSVVKGGTLPATGVNFTIPSGPFQFKGGAGYPGVGGSCGATITSNCTVVVTFAPVAAGNFSNQMSATFNDGNQNTQATSVVSGQAGTVAVISLSPATNPANFGSTPVNLTKTQNFTLTNAANTVTATAITLSVPAGAFAYNGGCGQSLSPGASCTFSVRFTPNSAGNFTGSLAVGYFDGVMTQTGLGTGLFGIGTSNAVLGFSISSYDFGGVPVGNTKTASINLTYYGSSPATVTSTSGIAAPFSYPGGTFAGSGNCGNTITAGCNFQVAFTPTAVANYSTVFSLTYDDGAGGSQTISIYLSGHGVQFTAAVLTFSQAPTYDFGNTAVNSVKTATITVNKTGSLNASAIAGSGLSAPFSFYGGSYPGSGGSCATTISASSCTLVIAYTPSAAGSSVGSLQLAYNDGFQNQQAAMGFAGKGVNLALLTASSGAFTSSAYPAVNILGVTITNRGARQTDSLVLVQSPSAPFSILSNGCPAQLAAGGTCLVQLILSPATPGQFTSNLGFNYLDGLSQQSVASYLTAGSTVPELISVNGNFSCARNTFGQLKCWGQNNYGQLGQGDTTQRGDGTSGSLTSLTPINLGTNHFAVAITTGFFHACALLEDNSLKCWGSNLYGQLGQGNTNASYGSAANQMGDNLPVVNLGAGKFPTAISSGYAYSCALLNDGGVKCWGQNDAGQLGLGDTVGRGTKATDMGDNLLEVSVGARVTQLTTGTNHTCVILQDKTVRCWGDNFFGELGQGDFQNRGVVAGDLGSNLPAIDLGTGRTALSVEAGGAFTCAILDNHSLKCWGRNENGILGNTFAQDSDGNVGPATNPSYPLALRGYGIGPDQMGDVLAPVPMGTGRTVRAIATADSSICATLDDNSIKCWGENQYGQLGQGDTVDRGVNASDMGNNLLAVSLGSGLNPVAVRSGNFQNCALFDNGQIKCWGYNHYGNLGLGDTNNRGDSAGEMGSSLSAVNF